MRKGIAIALMAVLLFFTAGYHLLFYLRIAEAKADMKQAILQGRPENLTRFQFSTTDFERLIKADETEFEYRGEWYDVVKTERSAAGVAVWCLSDEKEKEAVNAYLNARRQTSPDNPSNGLTKLLSLPFIPVVPLQIATPVAGAADPESFYPYYLPNRSPALLSPPPKRC